MWDSVQTHNKIPNIVEVPNISEFAIFNSTLWSKHMNKNIKVSKFFLSALIAASIAGPIGVAYAQDGENANNKNGVMMKDGKMMMRKDGKMMMMNEDMTMPNGTKVMRDGKIMMKDGTSRMMKNGEMMDMTDKAGG